MAALHCCSGQEVWINVRVQGRPDGIEDYRLPQCPPSLTPDAWILTDATCTEGLDKSHTTLCSKTKSLFLLKKKIKTEGLKILVDKNYLY